MKTRKKPYNPTKADWDKIADSYRSKRYTRKNPILGFTPDEFLDLIFRALLVNHNYMHVRDTRAELSLIIDLIADYKFNTKFSYLPKKV